LFISAAATCSLGAESASLQSAVNTYCINCHDRESNKGGLNLEAIAADRVTDHTEIWEKVVRKLERRQMPPVGKKRPDEQTYSSILSQIQAPLNQAAMQRPNPGRTDTIRRLYAHRISERDPRSAVAGDRRGDAPAGR